MTACCRPSQPTWPRGASQGPYVYPGLYGHHADLSDLVVQEIADAARMFIAGPWAGRPRLPALAAYRVLEPLETVPLCFTKGPPKSTEGSAPEHAPGRELTGVGCRGPGGPCDIMQKAGLRAGSRLPRPFGRLGVCRQRTVRAGCRALARTDRLKGRQTLVTGA